MIPREPPAEIPAEGAVDWLFCVVFGIVEGLTEFIPVSSTGHLIVTARAFGKSDPAFEIGIQMGAITAILFLYWGRIFTAIKQIFAAGKRGGATRAGQPNNLIWLLFMAALPAGVLGFILKDVIVVLLFNNVTVAVALIVGGVGFLVLEWWLKRKGITEEDAIHFDDMSLRQAFQIGMFQCLALIPGMSRSGATIAGAMVLGFRRTASAEFSFLVGLPILYGAALVKLRDYPQLLIDKVLMTEFVIASVAAFLSAVIVVKPFVKFLQRHTFVPFGWYRIVAGAGLLWLVSAGYLTG